MPYITHELPYKGDLSEGRSYRYQTALYEFGFSDKYWDLHLNHDPSNDVDPQIIDYLKELDGQLEFALWILIDTKLTSKQRAVCQLLKIAISQEEGQEWIAQQLGVNQSSVATSFIGKQAILKDGSRKKHGGIGHKLAGCIRDCKEIHEVIKQIDEIYEEEYGLRLVHYKCFKKIIGTI